MAIGTVNVPGVSNRDLVAVRTTANDAKTLATEAKAAAQTASTTAGSANTTANEAKAAAAAAQAAAEAATATANEAKSAADGAQTAAASAQAAAEQAASDLADINQAIEEGGGSIGGGGGNTIKITFEDAFAGQTYTVTDGDETKTGTVPEGLVVSVKATNCNSTYTIKATASNGVEYSTSVVTGAYYGQYTASLSVFNATINVTAVAGAVVKAVMGSSTFTALAESSGVAAVHVNQTGTYTVSATKDGVPSNSAAVNVTAESTYTATVSFIVLTVTSEPGATLTLANGETTLTGGGTGTDVFYLPNTGTWTATLTDTTGTEETATKSITVTEYKGYTLKVMFVSDVLDENDWEKIKDVSDAGEGANYWKVGDTKSITINGKVGNFTFSNLSVQAFILGFNHNSAKEGDKRIHFQIGKISGKMVGLCDSQYNSSGSGDGFRMNKSDTNSGGWNNSYMRKTLLGNSNAPGSPLANSLMAALPADLRSNMKSVSKYTDNTGGGSNTASYVTATTDYLFLLSEFEVQGSRNYANSAEQNSQKQYDYYKAGNSKIAYNHSSTGTAVWWWLRSPYYTNYDHFCGVNTDGTYDGGYAYYSAGVLPGFAV